ncbi:MAG: iron-containing alcohol dehydrogenase, partial [Methylobacterium sp.]
MKASRPQAAVSAGGRLTVSAGSSKARSALVSGPQIQTLSPRTSEKTEVDEVSEPVPAVVGIRIFFSGSALDVAKVAACLAVGEADPMHYALAINPLPVEPLKKILIPTTAGTGSETSSTSVFSDVRGDKVWIWGPETKADLAL